MAQRQYIQRWLIDMLNDGPYRDEREVKAEQRQIRENARAEVDKIWAEQQRKLAPPPVEPIPQPDWGTAPPPPSFQESAVPAPSGNSGFVETPPSDPGIGVATRLDDGYWAVDPRPQGRVETIA